MLLIWYDMCVMACYVMLVRWRAMCFIACHQLCMLVIVKCSPKMLLHNTSKMNAVIANLICVLQIFSAIYPPVEYRSIGFSKNYASNC